MGIGQGHSQYQTSIACATTTTTLVRDLFQYFFSDWGGRCVHGKKERKEKKTRGWSLGASYQVG